MERNAMAELTTRFVEWCRSGVARALLPAVVLVLTAILTVPLGDNGPK